MARRKQKGRLLGVHCSIAGGVQNAPLVGGRIGCTAIQLFTGSNQQWRAPRITKRAAESFLQNMSEQGIRSAVAHACYLINLASPDRTIYAKSKNAMAEELGRAELLRIPWVIVHPGSHRERGMEWGIERIAEALNRVLDKTGRLAAGVALETTAGPGSSIGSRFEELAGIMERVEDRSRVAVCFDTCHAFAAGYELRTKAGYAKTWRDFDRSVGIRNLVAIHLNDSKTELGSRRDRHEHIGEGMIGLAGFRLMMNDRRLKKVPMILETPKEEDADSHDSRNLGELIRLIR